jgi:hypothetical protein
MRTHEAAAERHEQAAQHWSRLGDEERAELERELVVLERDMARVARERPIPGSNFALKIGNLACRRRG